jgi:hypothetical protein
MLPHQIVNVVSKYVALLRARGYPALKADTSIVNSPDIKLRHAAWMCEHIYVLVSQGELSKADRWLGFVQAILWCYDIQTVDQMRDDNRG